MIKIRQGITLENYLQQKASEVDFYLEEWLSGLTGVPSSLVDSMRYSLLGGGKRIRPVLLLATVSALNGDEQKALPIACAIEMIHTYSLIHDDLPCMDDDDYRRGKLTNHKMFGEAQAVLTGDALLTEAFGLIAQVKEIPPKILLTIIKEGASFAGACGMIGGQIADVESVQKILCKEELDTIHLRKTVNLITYAVRSGAHLCGAEAEILELLTRFSVCVGHAFQIQDDILDVIGDPSITGKQTGSDRDKMTYPVLIGLEKSQKELQLRIATAKSLLLDHPELHSSVLLQIADFLLIRDR